MANYLFDKYNVAFGSWSGEVHTYSPNGGSTGPQFWGYYEQPFWNGDAYVNTELSRLMNPQTHWSASNYATSSSKTHWKFNGYTSEYSATYDLTAYSRTRSASPTTLVQTGIVGTINEYPIHGYHSDGFYYIRTGIENKPLVTAPNGGESLNELFTITFTDNKPTAGIRYQIQLSLNNGVSWKDIIALTAVGATSYPYNFINEPATSTAKVRVRAYDGQNYGAWDESNGVFTIQHNVAPTNPTNLTPSGIIVDRTKTQQLTWKHNDDDAQSKAVIEWRAQGSPTWNTITSNGSEQHYYIAANTFPTGQIEWRVRTYDQQSLVSPYSVVAVFSSAEPTNAPSILSPTSPVSISRPLIKWAGGAQASYQIVITDALSVTVWDTGEVTSGNKARTVDVDLLNGGTYTIKLRIKDAGGLFSSFVETIIVISYTPPVKPIATIYKEIAGVGFVIDNPPNSGTQPIVLENEIYKWVNDDWMRIAKNLTSVYTDYTLASEESVRYRVRAIGENGTFSESDVIETVAPKLVGVYLYDVQDPEMSLHHFERDGGGGRSDDLQREHAFRQFAGRSRPVIVYGAFSNYQVRVSIKLMRDEIGRNRLIQYVNDGAILLYRDGRGRKIYTTLPTLPMIDAFSGNVVDLEFTEIDYREEV